MSAPSLLGKEWTSWRHFVRSIFFHSSRMTSFRDWMLDGEWCSTCLFRIPHRCSIGFRSGDILGHWITFTLFVFRNPTVALDRAGVRSIFSPGVQCSRPAHHQSPSNPLPPWWNLNKWQICFLIDVSIKNLNNVNMAININNKSHTEFSATKCPTVTLWQ